MQESVRGDLVKLMGKTELGGGGGMQSLSLDVIRLANKLGK